MSTLQEKYNLIKEGKGSKYTFLTESKKQFPDILTNPMGFEEASKALIRRGVISEGYVDLHPINSINNTPKTSFETAFDKFINEESKKEKSPKVEDYNKSAYDPKDKKNLDNQIGQEVLKGIYYEGRENPDLTLEELRKLVSKNLEKDGLYYVKNAMFGIKDLGYQEPDSFEVSGKHKSSGYSDKTKKVVKESFDMGNIGEEQEEKKEITKPKSKKVKKDTLETRLAEIDKQGAVVALEAKIGMVDEAIDKKNSRISMVSEDENLSELVDKTKIKGMQREVKVLEKRKAKMEKMYEKMCGKSYSKPEMVDEDQESQNNLPEA